MATTPRQRIIDRTLTHCFNEANHMSDVLGDLVVGAVTSLLSPTRPRAQGGNDGSRG